MKRNAAREVVPTSLAPSVARLRLAAPSHGTLLDGGWWPRPPADPAAELPGLIAAIEDRHGQITSVSRVSDTGS